MNKNYESQLRFLPVQNKKVTAVFDEPLTSSDGGALLLREIDKQLGLTSRLVEAIDDKRRQTHIEHELDELISQRTYQICCGYEDADDCDSLKGDPIFKMAVGRDPQEDPNLGSQPTMSRLENSVTVRDLLRIGYGLIDIFISSYRKPPTVIVLDMDPTADEVHGKQEMIHFNGLEDCYCFMPFHVYEGVTGDLITTILRPGKTPTFQEIIAILKRIVRRIRNAWPDVDIIFRADSHHTKPELMEWMDKNTIDFCSGLSPNSKLYELFDPIIQQAKKMYQLTGKPVRELASAFYQAGTWDKLRRVICRVNVTEKGTDVRCIVTSFENAGAKYLYDGFYSDRGRMELMIKDHKNALKSDRTSCTRKEANQFRLFLHSAAYVLMHAIRKYLLKGSDLATSQFDTIRLKLLKIGTRVEVGKRFLRLHFPISYPLKSILFRASSIFAALNTT